jgi:hypothetical protein
MQFVPSDSSMFVCVFCFRRRADMQSFLHRTYRS